MIFNHNLKLILGNTRILFTADEVAQITAACEEWLIAANTITAPFFIDEIQGGILKDHLIKEDYLALQKVTKYVIFVNHNY